MAGSLSGTEGHRRSHTCGRQAHHRRAAGVLVLPADSRHRASRRSERRLATHANRSLRAGTPREGRPRSRHRRGQAHADPPRHAGPDRVAADAGGDRRLREGRLARCVRQGRRSPARVAALRRNVGAPLARRRALWRGRLSEPRPDGARLQPVPECVPVSRLGDQGVQRRPAVRPVRQGAARRRSARREDPRPHAAGARVPRPRAVVLRQRRGGGHARRRAARSRGRGVARLPRPDGRLRALPRPQVRSDFRRRTTTRWRACS